MIFRQDERHEHLRGDFVTRFCQVLRVLLFLLLVTATLSASETASSAFERGKEEEAHQNYEEAYVAYKVAYTLQPTNIEYRSAATRLQFMAAAAKVHRGVQLRDTGKLREALLQFEAAHQIDPSSPIARQQIESTKKAIAESQTPDATDASSEEDALSAELDAIQGPIKLAPVGNVPITLKISEDTRVVYETIGKLAGINVLFDPEYVPRRIRVELTGVNLLQALETLALQSKTFWRPVTPNTIFVATDNPAKRKELEQSVVKTFYLSNLSQPTELQDVVNAVRTVLEVSRIQQLPSQQAIVMRGTPDQILLAEKIVHDIDKALPEVVVEVAVMQVSRDKVKNLGINPPSSASVQLQSNTSTTSSTSSSSTSGTTSSTSNSLSLNSLAYLNASDFQVTIGAASLNALASDSSTKIIQNPQLRSINGQKASLKIGERVPTATGSYSSGVTTGTVSALVNTQFQYLDVGVNVDITPRVFDNGDIGLKVGLDVSSVTGYVSIGGISEPEIGQRKIEHEIRLKDGEVNLLGGMFETQETKSVSGIPGLSNIPVLKYLFSETSKETINSEIVFALIPHIVRARDIVPLNRRTLDVGTANGIQLHSAQNHPATTGSQKQSASIVPVSVSQATVAATTMAAFDPPSVAIHAGSTFAVNVMLSNVENASSVPLRLIYDPDRLGVLNVSNGGFLDQGGQIVALSHREDTSAGVLECTALRPRGSGGASGSGVVVTITFLAKSTGLSRLTVADANVVHPDGQMLAIPATEMSVTVQ
jgi:general secretion pathway protein D